MKKILWIVVWVILIVILYLMYARNQTMPNTEGVANNIETENTTIDEWRTYENKEYGFEIRLPKEYEVRSQVQKAETTNGCVRGESIEFYFYRKWEAPIDLIHYWVGWYIFTGDLRTSDYQALESSTVDNSFCWPVWNIDEIPKITLSSPTPITYSTVSVYKPIQSVSCDIRQFAEFKVTDTKGKYSMFKLQQSLDALELPSWDLWETECVKIFDKNSAQLSLKIEEFETIAKSFRFTDIQN